MIIILYSLIIISAILVGLFDYKYKKIPWWLLIINYTLICMVVNKWLLFGNIVIILAKIFDFPIDILYIGLLIFCIATVRTYLHIIPIMLLCFYIMIDKNEKMSFMIPIECASLFEMFLLVSVT